LDCHLKEWINAVRYAVDLGWYLVWNNDSYGDKSKHSQKDTVHHNGRTVEFDTRIGYLDLSRVFNNQTDRVNVYQRAKQ